MKTSERNNTCMAIMCTSHLKVEFKFEWNYNYNRLLRDFYPLAHDGSIYLKIQWFLCLAANINPY